VWDDSLVEPLVQLAERTAGIATGAERTKPDPASWSSIYHVLRVLDRHHEKWPHDPSIPPRLSRAVLAILPGLVDPKQDPRPGEQLHSNAMSMLSMTRDPAMVAVLRPFLDECSTLGGNGLLWVQLGAARRLRPFLDARSSLGGNDRLWVQLGPARNIGSKVWRDIVGIPRERDVPVRTCDEAALAITQLLGEPPIDRSPMAYSSAGIYHVQLAYPKWEEMNAKIALLKKRLDAEAK
jgi:hypothetical protein